MADEQARNAGEPAADAAGGTEDSVSEPASRAAQAPRADQAYAVYDPYLIVDPSDKAGLKRQRALERAAKKGLVPVVGETPEAFAQRSGGARPASTAAVGADAPGTGDGSGAAAEKQPRPRRGRGRRVALATLALVLVAALAGGGYAAYNALRPIDMGAYATTGISISGIEDDDFIVTAEQLAQLPCVEQTVTGQGQGSSGESKAGTVTAYGPTLETFLAQYGLEATDFTRIIAFCKDGYTVVLARDSLEDEVILTVAMGKDSLDPYQQPLRFVIPDQASGQWGYGVLRIEFER